MPHDLSRSANNSASSSALSYDYDPPESSASSTNHAVNHHHHHKNAKNFNHIEMIDDDDDDDDDLNQQKKVKRVNDSLSLAGQEAKQAIINAEMIFYCFEILGNYLFNGRHHSSRHNHSIVPTNLPKEPYPLFVTWFIGKEKKLRGCIGTFSPMNLAEGLREYAITSAINDSRFSPISRDEYPSLSCAVSILTQFEPCSSFADWQVGLHGIRIEFVNERGAKRSATYLPEVAHEQGWNHVQTLDSLLRKGGYRAAITSDTRKSVQVTRYRSEKLTLHYDDYVQSKPAQAK